MTQKNPAVSGTNTAAFREGMQDGVPIGLGYLAVAFSLGITARSAGLTAVQGFFASLLTNASAGEYAAFTVIAAGAPYFEMFLVTLVTNARYLLMSCALSQHIPSGTSFVHRLLLGNYVTDELFGITVARQGRLNPWYTYGAASIASPGWAIGTAAGIIAGNVLPPGAVSALSVALYGMFLAVIIPPARKSRVIAGLVLLCFAASFAASRLAFLSGLSAGTRTIILTVTLSAAAAVLFPVPQEEEDHE